MLMQVVAIIHRFMLVKGMMFVERYQLRCFVLPSITLSSIRFSSMKLVKENDEMMEIRSAVSKIYEWTVHRCSVAGPFGLKSGWALKEKPNSLFHEGKREGEIKRYKNWLTFKIMKFKLAILALSPIWPLENGMFSGTTSSNFDPPIPIRNEIRCKSIVRQTVSARIEWILIDAMHHWIQLKRCSESL